VWSDDRTYSLKALARIAPGTKSADAAMAALTAAVDLYPNSYPNAQLAALEALPAFGAKAAVAVPRIRELSEDRRIPDVQRAAAAALRAFEGATSKDQRPSIDSPKPIAN
jgi:hypothetical protein